MIKKNNIIVLSVVITFSLIFSFIITACIYERIYTVMTQDNDFLYNAISFSAVIGGFLFTAVGILMSAMDKERIKRLWDNYYLDNMYRFAFAGIISNVVTFLNSWTIIFMKDPNENLNKAFLYVEMASLLVGVVSFLACIIYMISIMKKMHNN